MQPGNSKHAAWADENLAHDAQPVVHGGPGTGRVESWRDPDLTADDDLGTRNGSRWYEPDDEVT